MRVQTCSADVSDADRALHARIESEFREMPGLKVTLWQASRLFNIELAQCEQLFSLLVQAGAFRREGDMFMRAGTGRLVT
jgi:hypothetical protein